MRPLTEIHKQWSNSLKIYIHKGGRKRYRMVTDTYIIKIQGIVLQLEMQ